MLYCMVTKNLSLVVILVVVAVLRAENHLRFCQVANNIIVVGLTSSKAQQTFWTKLVVLLSSGVGFHGNSYFINDLSDNYLSVYFITLF